MALLNNTHLIDICDKWINLSKEMQLGVGALDSILYEIRDLPEVYRTPLQEAREPNINSVGLQRILEAYKIQLIIVGCNKVFGPYLGDRDEAGIKKS